MSKLIYSNFLSRRAARRRPSAIRELQQFLKIPGIISLGSGNPNADLFPFKDLTVTLKNGDVIPIRGSLLDTALQYSPSNGLPVVVEDLKNRMKKLHTPPYQDWEITVTTGSQDGVSKVFEALLDEEDTLLTENPTYSGALAAAKPLGCNIVGIDADKDGLNPSHLADVMSNFPTSRKSPKALYLIPTGQNPSGAILSFERRKQIYSLASKYNFLILEDDPYYHMQFLADGEATIPSLMSLDLDGRVIRFDSLSKVVSSGLRFGWATGPKPLIQNVILHQMSSELHCSSMSQAMVYSLLQHWGEDGWNRHIRETQDFYRKQRDDYLKAIERHLTGVAEWNVPRAGMFGWIRLKTIPDTKPLIAKLAQEAKVLFVAGHVFDPSHVERPSAYLRASFSTASAKDMDEAFRRLRSALDELTLGPSRL